MKKIIKILLCLVLAFGLVRFDGGIYDGGIQEVHAATYAENIVAEALKHLGKPYVWATSGPNTFDCSGFVSYVYRVFGITLPTGTAAYRYGGYTKYGGTRVEIENLIPGDVVLFGSSETDITHAGLYIGNGVVINALNERYGVCYMYLNYDCYENYHGAKCNVYMPSSYNLPALFGVRMVPTYSYTKDQTQFLPKGALTSASATSSTITVSGYAHDPNYPRHNINVKVYANNTLVGTTLANKANAACFTRYGITGNHGYNATFNYACNGPTTIQVYGVDFTTGEEKLLGTQTVSPIGSGGGVHQPAVLPVGAVDSVEVNDQTVSFRGWAYDPEHTGSRIYIHAYLGSTFLGEFLTDTSRSDVNSLYGLTGNHGFNISAKTTLTGNQQLKIYAMDYDTDDGTLLGTYNLTIGKEETTPETNTLPHGYIDNVRVDGQKITMTGWAYDANHPGDKVTVSAYIGNVCLGEFTTGKNRPDVNAAYNLTGDHGFDVTTTTTLTGNQTLKIYAKDMDSTEKQLLGTYDITIGSLTVEPTNKLPTGSIELAELNDGKIKIKGWAFDQDSNRTGNMIYVDVYLGDTFLGEYLTDQIRTDINTKYGLTGKHGFEFTCAAEAKGKQTLKIYAMDYDTDDGALIGSFDLDFGGDEVVEPPVDELIPVDNNQLPVGVMDYADVSGNTVSARGWVYDPNEPSKELALRFYLNDDLVYATKTNILRTDVNASFNIINNHGYNVTFNTSVKTGTYEFSIFAIDPNTGEEKCVGWKMVTVDNGTAEPSMKFSDVKSGDWYYSYIEFVNNKGIMTGYSGTDRFGPNDVMTRSQMVQVLYNLAGKPATTSTAATKKFSDVSSGDWYEAAVNWAYANGITVGMGDQFGVSVEMTREQMVTFLMNYAKTLGLDVSKRSDISGYYGLNTVSDWAKDNMNWAITIGVISGIEEVVDGKTVRNLSGTTTATRAQVAAVFTKFCNYYGI